MGRDEALIQAIKLFKQKQSCLSQALGISRKVVNGWLNQAYKIPIQQALMIEVLTKSGVRAEDLCPYAKKEIVQFKRYWRDIAVEKIISL